MSFTENASTTAAVEALRRGFTAIPIRGGEKRPHISGWTHIQWDDTEQVRSAFDGFAKDGATNVGLLLGTPSGGLIDVDLDHPKALRLRDLLPKTAMVSGRPGRSRSHYWYRVTDELPGTRTCKMPDGSMVVELRSTGAQTVIPPSTHPSLEVYRWEGEAWGGEEGPAVVSGPKLAMHVALLGLGAVLLQEWPTRGGRHEAYLALAGGLLRYGDGIHPWWQKNLPALITAMGIASNDEEVHGRAAEVMGTTITRLQEKGTAVGFPKLGEIIGVDHAEQARRLAREVEKVGWRGERPPLTRTTATGTRLTVEVDPEALVSTLPPEKRNPLAERITPWSAVDLEPYLTGKIVMEPPSILKRSDGHCLMYPGRVNLLFGMSESAKSWVALLACVQEMAAGGRVLYLDFEDSPEGTIGRLLALGVGADDIDHQFRYILPDGPLAEMQRNKFGGDMSTDDGKASSGAFRALIETFDPTLIIADGMTVLFGIHGQDTNDATSTEIITGWLKRLCRTGATVVVIDHTGKGGGDSPIGAHQKMAMVQGTMLRVDVIDRPMLGEIGTCRIVIFKDRPSQLRKVCPKPKGGGPQIGGIVTLDSRAEGQTKMWIDPVDPDEIVVADSDAMEKKLGMFAANEILMGQLVRLFEGDYDKELTNKEACGLLDVDLESGREAWDLLVSQGKVDKHGDGRGRKYTLHDPSQD